MQDMDALVCRRTLTGHRNDVLCITGIDLHSQPPAVPPTESSLTNGHNSSSLSLEQASSALPRKLHLTQRRVERDRLLLTVLYCDASTELSRVP